MSGPAFPIRGMHERHSRLVDVGGTADSNFRRKRLIPGLSHRGVFRDRSAFLSPAACSFWLKLCSAMLRASWPRIVRRIAEIEKNIKKNRMCREID